MNYPLISEYIDAIKAAEDNFDKLANLRPVLDEDGEPVMSSGNFAVVFKMEDPDTGKLYAVKCFLKEQEGREKSYRLITRELQQVESPYLIKIKYLEKELFVDASSSEETEFPVLLMDWVEGVTLDKYIRNHINGEYGLALLAYEFSKLAMWLIPQPFAHGDLKPDNILVRADGSLVLVDYDGMYVPAMKRQKARELGSPDFRHPARSEYDFDDHIDDFSLAVILLTLYALSLEPSLLAKYGAQDRLLLSAKDYQDLSKSEVFMNLWTFASDATFASLLSAFALVYGRRELVLQNLELLEITGSAVLKKLRTDVTQAEWEEAVADEYGVLYSKDGKRLLRGRDEIRDNYFVRSGTLVICDSAFRYCSSLTSIHLPDSIKIIGSSAFEYCSNLTSIYLPDSLIRIGICTFRYCSSLTSIHLPDSLTSIGSSAFSECESLSSIHLPDSLTSIGSDAFFDCKSLTSIHFPDSVISIGSGAFYGCKGLTSMTIPNSVISLGEAAFSICSGLKSITLPNSVTSIGNYAFSNCI